MRSIFYSSSSEVFQLVNESVNEYSQQLSIPVDVRFSEFTTVRGALENISLKGVGGGFKTIDVTSSEWNECPAMCKGDWFNIHKDRLQAMNMCALSSEAIENDL